MKEEFQFQYLHLDREFHHCLAVELTAMERCDSEPDGNSMILRIVFQQPMCTGVYKMIAIT